MKPKFKSLLINIGVIALFIVLSCIYFSPALGGKIINQGDMLKAEAMSAEQDRVKEATGTCPNWTSSMFSGMPGYQTAVEPQKSVFTKLKSILILRPFGVERNIGMLFLYLLGFYVAMLALGVSPMLAMVGALAFGLGSYNIIIIEAGHITKGWAIAMMAPILAGMVTVLKAHTGPNPRKRYFWGGLLFAIALGLQITFNHIQITFYTLLAAIIIAVIYLVDALRTKTFKPLLVGGCILLVGAAFAVGCNVRHLLVNEEYAKYTMRGGSEITVTPEDLYHDGEPQSIASTSGLDRDYAFRWSYGVGETYTLLVPGALGGGSNERVSDKSATFKAFHQNRSPLYWGEQPFTSGPVYFGAIVIMLFIFGLCIVKGPERWWLAVATLLAIVMSWGSNFMAFNEALFNHLPLYNKFRTPSMSLVLANVCMVMLAILSLSTMSKMLKSDANSQKVKRELNTALYLSGGITAGIIIIGLVISGGLDFSGAADREMAEQYGSQWGMLLDIFVKDRKALFRSDSLRSLLFIALTFAMMWLYVNEKLRRASIVYGALALLVVIDLWGVDRRYLDADNFIEPRKVALRPAAYDLDIDRVAAAYGDKDFRVYNRAVNTFNDSKPSAFHHQIGGYSAAKLRRYQDVIDFYLSRHINPSVLNMLNTRYFVVPGNQGAEVQRNVAALGNVWFVDSLFAVEDANAEILALNSIDPSVEAVVDASQWSTLRAQSWQADSSDYIDMKHERLYNPDYLTYESNTKGERLAVFSEVYYAPDWRAYIDGKPADYFRVNYILRAMIVPAGHHTIEFRNEAPRLHSLDRLTVIFSIVFVVLVAGAACWIYVPRKRKQGGDDVASAA